MNDIYRTCISFWCFVFWSINNNARDIKFLKKFVLPLFSEWCRDHDDIFLFPSAQSWLIISPASMVFPRPTPPQRIAPLERGQLKANKAASIWWGLRSTVEEARVWFNFFNAWYGRLRVSSWASIFWWNKGIAWFEVDSLNSSKCTAQEII